LPKARVGRCLAAVLLLAGCAGLPVGLADPDVHLDRVVVRSVGLTGGTMDLVVSLYNPNQFDLAGTKLQLGFDVEDSHVGDLTYDDDFQMQKGDTTTLSLPLGFSWNGLAAAAQTALGRGELPYTLRGQLSIRTPFGDHSVPFTREGRAPLSRVAGAVLPRTGHAP
jgi:LEA14-like dessication related protein